MHDSAMLQKTSAVISKHLITQIRRPAGADCRAAFFRMEKVYRRFNNGQIALEMLNRTNGISDRGQGSPQL
jgi:hypothetical protein